MAEQHTHAFYGLKLTRGQTVRSALYIGVPSGVAGLNLSLLAPLGHPWAAAVAYTAAIACLGTALLLWQLVRLARIVTRMNAVTAAFTAAIASAPYPDFASVWPELTGWVQAAFEDGESIDPADLLPYLEELKQRAHQPAQDWLRAQSAGPDQKQTRR